MIWNLLIGTAAAQAYDPGSKTMTGLANWNVDLATHDFGTMLGNLFSVLMNSIVSVCAAVFITGALLYIIGSFGKEDLKSNGKNMMIGSIIALVIVALARAIVHLSLYFMYAGSL